MSDDLEQAARLIEEIGRCYTRGRRYRHIANFCEQEILGRALRIGDGLRARARVVASEVPSPEAAVRELESLVAACEAAIRNVRSGSAYCAAETAWRDARWHDVAAHASDIFAAIAADAEPRPLYAAVDVGGGRRADEHFVAASAVAARIEEWLRDGIPAADPPPELGADDILRAVVLDDDADLVGTPVTLAIDAARIALPRFRLDPAGETLIYAPRVRVPACVRCAAEVTDEWWAIRPDAYERYVSDLAQALAARGITILERD